MKNKTISRRTDPDKIGTLAFIAIAIALFVSAISVFRKGLEMVEGFLEHALALVLYLFAVFHSENKLIAVTNKTKNVQ